MPPLLEGPAKVYGGTSAGVATHTVQEIPDDLIADVSGGGIDLYSSGGGFPSHPANVCDPTPMNPLAQAFHDGMVALDIGATIAEMVNDGDALALDLDALLPPVLTGDMCTDAHAVTGAPAAVTAAAQTGAAASALQCINLDMPPEGILEVNVLACTPPQPAMSEAGPIEGLCTAACIASLTGVTGNAIVLGGWVGTSSNDGGVTSTLLPLMDLTMLQEVDPSLFSELESFNPPVPQVEDYWAMLELNPELQYGPAADDGQLVLPLECKALLWPCENGGFVMFMANPDCCDLDPHPEKCLSGATGQLAEAQRQLNAALKRAKLIIASIVAGLVVSIILCAARTVGRGIVKKVKELEDAGELGWGLIKELGQELVSNPGSLIPFLGGAILELLVRQVAGPLSWAILAGCVAAALGSAALLIIDQVLAMQEAWARYRMAVSRIKSNACGGPPPAVPDPTSDLGACFG